MAEDERVQGVSRVPGTGGRPLVVVLPDPETLAHAVATAILAEANLAIRRSGGFALALSGGTTPKRVYELLSHTPFEEDMPWAATDIYWSDERCVDPEDLRSNELMARVALLEHVLIPEAQIHPMRCPESAKPGHDSARGTLRAEKTAAAYEKLLRSRSSAMDLVLLGLGEDGHTASLFPGADVLSERERWVASALGGPASGDEPGKQAPLWRVTLTPDCINRAASVFFMVSGAAKAKAVRLTLEGGAAGAPAEATGASADDLADDVLPARLIRPTSGSLCWFLDKEAASELEKSTPSDSRKESSP